MLEDLMTTEEAANELNIHVRTVRRYVKKGFIEATKQGHKILISDSQIKGLKRYQKITPLLIKEAYVFNSSNNLANAKWYDRTKIISALEENKINNDEIIDNPDFMHNLSEIKDAIKFYSKARKGLIKQFYDKDSDVYTIEEITARLNIVDYHIIYNLTKEGMIDKIEFRYNNNQNKKKYFITKQSFDCYLGKDITERFYDSRFASTFSKTAIKDIDRTARCENKYIEERPKRKNNRDELFKKIFQEKNNSQYIFKWKDLEWFEERFQNK
ncbi:MAG: helix-turn-helix domain-containing protein [Nanoarchaeota archaeon]|nr:helix-turn-helix domain-containing protein [Nanoarchaeota archaeon]